MIRQTAWGNWYGYLGNRKVESFDGCGFIGGQEEQAKEWLTRMKKD